MRRNEEAWAEDWRRKEEDRLEQELEGLLQEIRGMRGERKRLMLKAVVGYIKGLIGDG